MGAGPATVVHILEPPRWSEAEVNNRLEHLLDVSAFAQMRARAVTRGVSNRTAAMAIGVEKVRAGKRLRGLFP